MKKIIILFSFLFVTLVHSQELIVHELDAPNATHYEDLEVLRPLLEDKKVVMLGEMGHSFGNIFEMKTRVVKFLHQELGFTTFAIEAPMYGIWKMNQNEFSEKSFNAAIYSMWADSKEFQDLVQYIEENNLKVIGFDSQVMAVPQFTDNFLAFCQENNIRIRLDEDDLGVIVEDVLDDYIYEEDEISFSRYKRELERIIRQIEKLPSTEENFYWLQLVKGILSESQRAFYETEEVLNLNYVNKSYNFRDAQMADNLLTYVKNNPEEKIMVWADNIHVINDMSSYTQPIIKEFKSMGTYISKALGDKAYSLATIYANDSLYNNLSKQWFKVSIAEDSFEAMLLSKGKDYLFINSNQEVLKQNINSRLLSYIDFYKGRVDQLHDGYIFIKEGKLSTTIESESRDVLLDERVAHINEALIKPKPTSKTSKFSGKLLDTKTAKPVPFVNVMLKEMGVYRMTDEKGNYTIDIPTDTNVNVTFSSMGYKELIIPVNDLKETLKLTPSFESLNEVVLVGHSTTPKKVLQKAIKNIKENYVLDKLNFERYGHYSLYQEDKLIQDLELISKDYINGYRNTFPVLGKVKQIKWNKIIDEDKDYKHKGLDQGAIVINMIRTKDEEQYNSLKQLRSFREDAIQFASILHKRRYKKFDLEFVTTSNSEYDDLYIIKFKTNRKSFGYINRWYPAAYSGEIYINKEDYAIVKVVQNWESTIKEEQIPKYYHWLGRFKEELKYKVEYISEYQKHTDGKYYASRYFNRHYSEETTLNDEFFNAMYEEESFLYNYSTENVEAFEFSLRPITKDTNLNGVPYNPEFWENFKLEEILEDFWDESSK